MAKAEIARTTGLSAQTVSVMMRRLEEEGLLQRGEPKRGKVGQPSIPMRLAESGAYFGGLKIGRRSADFVLTDFLGGIVSRARITYDHPRPETTVRFACDSFEQLSSQLTADQRSRIAGVGVALPFRLWEWAVSLGLEPDEMVGWRGFDIVSALHGSIGLPIFMQNDASAACGAELVFSSEERGRDFLYFYLGYFAGGGVVLNNKLFTGWSGNAGAFGSMPVPDGSGGHVQLIERASLCVLERAMEQKGADASSLWEPPAAWDVDEETLQAWIASAGHALAHAILSATSVLDVPEVMVDGWLPKSVRATLVETINTQIRTMNLAGIQRPKIKPGHVGHDARVMGAVSLPLSHRFLIE